MPIDKKQFWEDKIIGWEDIRYKRDTTNFNIFENFVNRTNKTLIYRLNTAFKILKPLLKDKKIVELGCGSGFLAEKIINSGAKSYIGYDISEKAISRAIHISKEKKINDRAAFFAKAIKEMKDIDADYIFSLGTTDWLDDDELDHMFYISRNSENLHSISEDRNSFPQLLHKLYVFLSYGRKTDKYVPRYYKTQKISNLIKKYLDKPTFNYRNKKMSFGTFVSTFEIEEYK
tara:strand:+ start:1468 stop:2160 length:693 start_codon:yes stop_codon:yes gene_type:complete